MVYYWKSPSRFLSSCRVRRKTHNSPRVFRSLTWLLRLKRSWRPMASCGPGGWEETNAGRRKGWINLGHGWCLQVRQSRFKQPKIEKTNQPPNLGSWGCHEECNMCQHGLWWNTKMDSSTAELNKGTCGISALHVPDTQMTSVFVWKNLYSITPYILVSLQSLDI